MKLKLIKFGSKTCPACKSMDRTGVLERIAQERDVEVYNIDISDEQGDSPPGSAYEKAYEMSDEYDVTALPTLIVETPDGGELVRYEGACNFKTLDGLVKEAQERLASRNFAAVGARRV
jgi:thiol-disulfide isomerase/thioredoxin